MKTVVKGYVVRDTKDNTYTGYFDGGFTIGNCLEDAYRFDQKYRAETYISTYAPADEMDTVTGIRVERHPVTNFIMNMTDEEATNANFTFVTPLHYEIIEIYEIRLSKAEYRKYKINNALSDGEEESK